MAENDCAPGSGRSSADFAQESSESNESNTPIPTQKNESSALRSDKRWETRKLVTIALFCALSILLSFLEFPIFPAAPFLKYDASFVPMMVGGFAYGAGPGVAIGVVTAVVHGLLLGDLPGSVMNILVSVAYVVPASLLYCRIHTRKGAIIGLVVGSLCAIAVAILSNLVITPFYMGVPIESVIVMIIPILLPFNALKMVANSILTLIVYKSISNLITPRKDQVSGK